MYENSHEKLLPRAAFFRRLAIHGGAAAGIVTVSLGLGAWGYHVFANLPWIDALLNAAMILTGMGPVDPLHTTAAKLFATAYALFSGVIFLSVAGLLVAPALHRFLHRFHLEPRK